jgi:NAD(P)-dependent dehydrogenase (short-subunit alcohol dehydrogenase family)
MDGRLLALDGQFPLLVPVGVSRNSFTSSKAPAISRSAGLPYMRRRRAGNILNITSMGGIITLPGLSYYHGSKFALEGISESLGKEVRDFGIMVTAVEPGGFRTDWAGRSMVRAARSIGDYDPVIEPIRKRRMELSGWQIGDHKKAARRECRMIWLNLWFLPRAFSLRGGRGWCAEYERQLGGGSPLSSLMAAKD